MSLEIAPGGDRRRSFGEFALDDKKNRGPFPNREIQFYSFTWNMSPKRTYNAFFAKILNDVTT